MVTIHGRFSRTLYVLLILFTAGPSAVAQNINWDNPAVGDYQTAANWSTQSVPTALDAALFANGFGGLPMADLGRFLVKWTMPDAQAAPLTRGST